MSDFFHCENIVKRYGERMILPGVSLTPRPHGITALLGASGCGKTTLLDILAGFTTPDTGAVYLRGRPCGGPGPDRGVVFQEAALFPWMSAADNVAAGLVANGLSKQQAQDTAAMWLERVGLAEHATQFPSELSGGQRQRVALARVLALEPEVLLMDEPFAALDAMTREQMHVLVADLQSRLNTTILLVTHDMAEACLLANDIHIMGTGQGIIHSFSIDLPRPRDITDANLNAVIRQLRQHMR